mgnify:CR=1 FL=1
MQPIEPHPIRQLTIELEINRHHGDEERAADAAGKAALRQQVTHEIWHSAVPRLSSGHARSWYGSWAMQ